MRVQGRCECVRRAGMNIHVGRTSVNAWAEPLCEATLTWSWSRSELRMMSSSFLLISGSTARPSAAGLLRGDGGGPAAGAAGPCGGEARFFAAASATWCDTQYRSVMGDGKQRLNVCIQCCSPDVLGCQ